MLKKFLSLLLLISFVFSSSFTIVFYYQKECPHCAKMEPLLEEAVEKTFSSYDIKLIKKEIYEDNKNLKEMLNLYANAGLDPTKGGVPTTFVDNRSIIIGEVDKKRLEEILSAHLQNDSIAGIYTQSSFTPINIKKDNGKSDKKIEITLPALIIAALADSINPCTIAIMVMLLSTVLATQGRKKMLLSAAVFIGIIFICYLIFGLGLREFLSFIGSTTLSKFIYLIVTVIALLLAIVEINAYFNYSPGFISLEMPMFLRPYAKKVISHATSLPAVATAALFCSFFLLPCSSGPYLVVLGMLASESASTAFFYLLIYNIIFILPMVAATVAILVGKTTIERVGAARDKYIREFHLFAGLLLLVLFFIMLSQIDYTWLAKLFKFG